MSMEVVLAAVSLELLERIKADPSLLVPMLFDEEGEMPAGFDDQADVYCGDYRHMFAPYFRHVAEAAGMEDPDDFDSCKAVQEDPMYRAIMGEDEIDFQMTYGPASYNTPKFVAAIASDWRASLSDDDIADTERADIELYLFCQRAADQGKAIICGVS